MHGVVKGLVGMKANRCYTKCEQRLDDFTQNGTDARKDKCLGTRGGPSDFGGLRMQDQYHDLSNNNYTCEAFPMHLQEDVQAAGNSVSTILLNPVNVSSTNFMQRNIIQQCKLNNDTEHIFSHHILHDR
jgi:hypothetical protein